MNVRQATTVSLTTDPDTGAFTVNVAAGSALMVLVEIDSPTISLSGITDSQGNTWALGVRTVVTARSFEAWSVQSANAGATTVTFNFTATPVARVWMVEVADITGLVYGISNTLDQTVSIDPVPLATLSPTQAGVVLAAIRYATTETFANWEERESFLIDNSGGSSSRGGFRLVDGAIALTPAVNNSTAATGESMTVVFYGTPVAGNTVLYPAPRACNVLIEGPGAGNWDFHGSGPAPDRLAMFTYRLDRQKGLGGSLSQPVDDQTCNQQGNYDVPTFCRWISPPVEAQTISGTFDLCQLVQGRWQDSVLGLTNDSVVRYKVHVYISVGQTVAVRATLLDNYVDSVNFPGTSGAVWRQLAAAQTLAAGVAQAGDSIIIETGFRIVSSPTPAASYPPDDWTLIDWTGLTTVGSFPDAVNGDTSTSRAPWFGFSIPIAFQPTSSVPPGNDACADATVVSALPYASAHIDTTEAQDTDRRVWFRFTAPSTGTILLTTFGSNYATTLDVYTGGCGVLTLASYGTLKDFGVGRSSTVALLNATSGIEYLVRIGAEALVNSVRDGGGMLRLTIGYRELPQEDDLYIPSRQLLVFRDGVVVNANPSFVTASPTGIAIDYTQRSMANVGGSPGGDPHIGERVLQAWFAFDPCLVEMLDLPTLSYLSSGASDIDIISDPFDIPRPATTTLGIAALHVTRVTGLLVAQFFGNGFLYVAGAGANRPAHLNTISSAPSISAVKAISAIKGDNQVGNPFTYVESLPTLESTAPWGGWLNEATGDLYYVSGSPYDCPLVPSQEIRVYNVFTQIQGPIFATLPVQSVFHPSVRGLCGILGPGSAFRGLLACNGNTVQKLDASGALLDTYTPTTPDANPHLGMMDVKILADGVHALTIDYVSRRVWKFNLLTMTEVSTYPTYMLGPFVQMVLYQPNGITPTPDEPCVLEVPSTQCWGDSEPTLQSLEDQPTVPQASQCFAPGGVAATRSVQSQPTTPTSGATWLPTFSVDAQRVGLKDS
jgi:hypothetical protein